MGFADDTAMTIAYFLQNRGIKIKLV